VTNGKLCSGLLDCPGGVRRSGKQRQHIDRRTRTWILYGNKSELGNAGREPGESYLFSLTAFNPGIRLTGDRVYGLQKYLMFEISCAKKRRERPL
jgi:hypothetical protein